MIGRSGLLHCLMKGTMTQEHNSICCLKQYKITVLFFHGPTQGFPTANIYANILQDVSSFPGDVHRIFAAHSMTFTLSEGK